MGIMEYLYLVLDWSSADMAGGDSKMLAFCNSEQTVAVVMCIGAG